MSIGFENSDRRFRIIFENSLAVMLLIDPETHRIVAANKAAEKFYGWKRSEIETMRVDDINTLSPAEIKAEMEKASESERIYFRFKHRLANGDVRDVEVYSGKVEIDGKDYLHSIIHDVTEQVNTENDLLQSQAYNRMLFKQSPIGHALTTMDGKLVDINPAFAAIIGHSVEEVKSLSYWDITPEKYAPQEQEQLESLEKTDRYGPYEKEYIHKEGHLVPVRLQGLIIEREGKKYIWSSVENISEQKKAVEEKIRLVNIIEKSRNEIYVFDEDSLRFEFVNQGALDNLGFSQVEMNGMTPLDIKPEFTEKQFRKILKPLKDGSKERLVFETLHQRKNRTTYPVEIYLQLQKSGNKSVFLAVINDITERKLTEEARQKSENQYRTLFETMTQGVVYQNAKGEIISANPAAEKILGLSLDQMTGRTSIDPRWKAVDENKNTLPGEKHPAMVSLRSGKEVRNFIQGIFNPKINDYVWILVNSIPQFKENEKKPYQVFSTFLDITDRKKAEEEFRVSEKRFRAIVEGAPDPIFIQTDYRFSYLNKPALRLFGANSETELLGKPIMDRFHPDFQQAIKKRIKQLNEKQQAVTQLAELKFITLHGEEVWVETSGEPIFYQGKHGGLVFVRDISERKKAEKALRKSEEQYRSLFENMNAGFVLFEVVQNEQDIPVDLIIHAANEGFEKTTGLNLKDAVGRHLKEVLPGIEKDEADWIGAYSKVALTGVSTHFEQGSELLGYYYSVSAFKTGSKQCAVTFVDITERKRAEEINRKSAERAKMQRNLIAQLTFEDSIVNSNIDDALKILTSKLSVNLQVDRVSVWLLSEDEKKLQRLALYDASTGLHSQIGDLNTADIPSYFEALRKESQIDADDARNDPRTKELTDNYLTPLQISSLLDSAIQQNGRLIGVLSAEHRGTVRKWHSDEESFLSAVTNLVAQLFANAERKQAEDAVRQNEEKLKSIFRVAPAGIGVIINRTFAEVNPKVCEITGYHSEELVGQSASILYPTQEEYEFVGKVKYRQIAKQGTGAVETRWQRKDGKIIDVFLSSTPVDSDDLSKGVTFTALDITERKRLMEELEILNAELELKVKQRTALLEASNKELEAFSYSVSHDLRAPLRHINGYVDLLNSRFKDELPEKAHHYLDTISGASSQMGTLIDDLLQYSRTGRKEIRKSELDLNALLKEVLEELKTLRKGRKITWDIQELPKVFGDYTLLKLVWTNLLDNAVKYTRNKQTAKISVVYKEEAKDFIFCVRDNGVGFDMKYAHKLFGVFQRLHSQAEFEGTGIGLANVQRIIHKHMGRVWAEADPGKGSKFYFSLPVNRKEIS